MDYDRNYLEHIIILADKSFGMYSWRKDMTSARWGISLWISRIICKAVFLSRVTYMVRIWERGHLTAKTIKKLGSVQRRPLLATTGANYMIFTNALQVFVGVLLLDLESREATIRQKIWAGLVDESTGRVEIEKLLEVWQTRWQAIEKGSWTKGMVPDVRRYRLPLTLDHFTFQIMTGHVDFRGKLYSFKLVEAPGCAYGKGNGRCSTYLYRCPKTEAFRSENNLSLKIIYIYH